MHANDETEAMFGYKRKELLGHNVSILMPKLIGRHHNDFINHYLSNGKLDWNDKSRQSYGQTKDGYLLPIELIVKVHPEISGRI